MNSDEKEYFDKISDVIGIKTDELPEEISNEIKSIDKQTNEIQQNIQNNLVLIKDQSFIDFELKDLISRTNNTLEKLESDIKIGTAPRMYEVYSTLVNTKRELLKELIGFNKLLLDMSMFSGKVDDEKEDKNTMNLSGTSSDMLRFFNELKKQQSELDVIDATFEMTDV